MDLELDNSWLKIMLADDGVWRLRTDQATSTPMQFRQ